MTPETWTIDRIDGMWAAWTSRGGGVDPVIGTHPTREAVIRALVDHQMGRYGREAPEIARHIPGVGLRTVDRMMDAILDGPA